MSRRWCASGDQGDSPAGFGSPPAPAGRAHAGTGGDGMRAWSCQHALGMILIPLTLHFTAYGDQGVPWPATHRLEFAGGDFGSPLAHCGWGWDAVAPTLIPRALLSFGTGPRYVPLENGGAYRVNVAPPQCTVGIWMYTQYIGAAPRNVATVHRRPAKHPTRKV
jgi:hypothetical protein